MTDSRPAPAAERPSILDQVEILRPLPAALKTQLESRLAERVVKPGGIVFSEGDPGDAMYIVTSGEVMVSIADKTTGLKCELARLSPGEAFGEMSLLTGAPRSATVAAVEETRLLALTREILHKLVQAAPQVGLAIASVLAKRIDDLNRNQGLAFGSLKNRTFDPALADLVPLTLIKRTRTVPVARENGILIVATPDPSNRTGADDIRSMLNGERVRVMVVPEADYNAWLTQHFSGPVPVAQARPPLSSLAKQVNFLSASLEEEPSRAGPGNPNQDAAPIVTSIIVEAIERRASDIHIEPDRRGVVVRYRIDGLMIPRDGVIPKALYASLISRLKVLAGLNITERRLPQDGRISLELAGKGYDLRLATVNAKYGEKATMRVLDSGSIQQQLSELILADKVAAVARKLFHQPNGLVLVTGPTGSGKTTTLYAALRERMVESLSICTVEDPIEYDLPGVTQVQVNEPAGLGFPEVLRAFMRQNPDVIFVGEMRDTTTARMACNAALTGHMVLSSLHTNDAVSSLVRLQSMGVEPFVISSAVLGIVNQRLVRRICPSCRAEAPQSDAILQGLRNVGVTLEPGTKLYRGKKCRACDGEGFKGRIGVYELLVVNQRVRDAMAAGADQSELRKAASDGSYVSLARYASFLLTQGLTEPSELLRILPREQPPGGAQG